MDYLPIFIQLQNRPVTVVGGGSVGVRKVDLLRKAGADVTVVAPQLHTTLAQLHGNGEIKVIADSFVPEHLQGMELVIAATPNRAVNAAVSAAARERGIPVNVVDDPELSTFICPAIIDRSPVIVAVSSGARSPVLSRRVREQLEALLPARLGALARFVGEKRQEVKNALPFKERRPFWERIISGIVGSRVLSGDTGNIEQAFNAELQNRQASGEVYLIGAGPGDPDLLTLRALQLLQRADVVLYDRLVSDAVVERSRRDAERIFVGKEPGGDHHQTQRRIHELMVSYAQRGLRVARLKGGDPFIFGRGGEEIEILRAQQIPYIVVPGITAALGAAAAASIPLTHRHLAHSVTFTAGHTLRDENFDWHSLLQSQHTLVFYMGVSELPRITRRLLAAGAASDLPVAIIERATLAEQRVIRATVSTVQSVAERTEIVAPALLIVGEVTTLARTDLDALEINERVAVEMT
jgi:uroporphyrin-III C-methyltransferase / precorrin-2 dehydrogenase / sirohydrochlorin ferrochelatase